MVRKTHPTRSSNLELMNLYLGKTLKNPGGTGVLTCARAGVAGSPDYFAPPLSLTLNF